MNELRLQYFERNRNEWIDCSSGEDWTLNSRCIVREMFPRAVCFVFYAREVYRKRLNSQQFIFRVYIVSRSEIFEWNPAKRSLFFHSSLSCWFRPNNFESQFQIKCKGMDKTKNVADCHLNAYSHEVSLNEYWERYDCQGTLDAYWTERVLCAAHAVWFGCVVCHHNTGWPSISSKISST